MGGIIFSGKKAEIAAQCLAKILHLKRKEPEKSLEKIVSEVHLSNFAKSLTQEEVQHIATWPQVPTNN